MINDYLTFILLALSITAIPGPAVILTLRNSLSYGYKASMANILGNFVAMLLLASISALGLGALILTSETLFIIMKVLGCLYLLYLGIKIWTTIPKQEAFNSRVSYKSASSLFKEGFFIGISNPKAIAFFTALFPQFIDTSRAYLPQFATLIFTIEGISCAVLLLYALLAFRFSKFLTQAKNFHFFNKLTASAFIGFGLALLVKEK